MLRRYFGHGIVALAIACATPLASQASTLGLDVTGGSQFGVGGFNNIGWEFEVTTAVTVDGLGVFDIGANGFGESHQVGIWNSVGALLVSTTVTSGSPLVASAAADGDWRFASIGLTVLAPGRYVIGAFYSDSSLDLVMANATILTIPGISFVSSRATDGAVFGEPGAYGLVEPGVFGPTFSTTTAVPEPVSLLLVGSGLLVGVARLRRRL